VKHLVPIGSSSLPALVAAAGDRAAMRFPEFFAANIRNPYTRRAYYPMQWLAACRGDRNCDEAWQPQLPGNRDHRLSQERGTLEKAAAMANHASTRTIQLYDRRRDEVSLDEVERIAI